MKQIFWGVDVMTSGYSQVYFDERKLKLKLKGILWGLALFVFKQFLIKKFKLIAATTKQSLSPLRQRKFAIKQSFI